MFNFLRFNFGDAEKFALYVDKRINLLLTSYHV